VAKFRFRKTIIAVHRDVGYFFAGLTVIYAISGVAVNHVEDWNPNYVVTHTERSVGELGGVSDDQIADEVLGRLGLDEKPKAAVRMSDQEYRIFLKDRTLQVATPSGLLIDEQVTRRPGFFHVNFLHLNHAKGLWTWYADIYAVGLLVLALTGIFIITGKKGMGGRGRWLLIAGTAIPLLFLLMAMN
jgi:hypothetical protein